MRRTKMSDKLLHEKMRELAERCTHTEVASITLNNGETVTCLNREELVGLADEIERYYIPRPRYEDGEPVQWGDTDVAWRETASYSPQVPWKATGVDASGRLIATAGDEIVAIAEVDENGRVKRLAPKLFDADGVPIEVGDTVWFCGDDSGRYTVSAVEPTLGGNWCLTVFNDAATIHEVLPSQVTHHEPDSLEKLRDDMRRTMEESPDARFMDSSWVDRLTALIERGL